MSRDQDFTTLEVLSIGIKSEIEAIKLYTRMKEMTKNSDLADKFDFLIAQERRHQKLLTDAYNSKFPNVDLKLPPKSLVPTISELLEREADLKDLFDAAMTAEKMSEEFYNDLAEKTRDQNSKSLLTYLASMEHSHYTILEVEYQQIQRGEDINSDNYLRGERLMNLGP